MQTFETDLENYLVKELDNCETRLKAAIHYAVLGPGRRWRPRLVYAIGNLLGASADSLLYPAMAVELIHAYTLVHDDLPAMDNDDWRRGLPTCHRQFDEATAILSGDALQTLAFSALSASGTRLNCEQQIAMVRVLAAACGPQALINGQAADLAAERNNPSLVRLCEIYQAKTGALFSAALELGHLCAPHYSPELASKLVCLGHTLGLAFQIQNDLQDIFDAQGRPAGRDAAQEKATIVRLLGLPATLQISHSLHTQLAQYLQDLPQLTPLVAVILQPLKQFLSEASFHAQCIT